MYTCMMYLYVVCYEYHSLFDDIIMMSYFFSSPSESLASMRVMKKKVFVDERWSRNRNVTSMDWSTHVR